MVHSTEDMTKVEHKQITVSMPSNISIFHKHYNAAYTDSVLTMYSVRAYKQRQRTRCLTSVTVARQLHQAWAPEPIALDDEGTPLISSPSQVSMVIRDIRNSLK